MLKIKRNDEVIIIVGKDKGKLGIVKSFLNKGRLIVSGINIVKKHKKSNKNNAQVGGIFEKEAGIHYSNVAIYNKKIKKADRVGFRFEEGKKVRFFKSNNELIDVEILG